MKINELYNFAENNNIEIVYLDFDITNGLFFSEDDKNYIILKSNLSYEEEICILAEEFTHFKVGVLPNIPFTNNYYDLLQRSKNECKACKYTTNKLVSLEQFKRYLNEDITKYEIAGELGITEEFVEKAYYLYK